MRARFQDKILISFSNIFEHEGYFWINQAILLQHIIDLFKKLFKFVLQLVSPHWEIFE